MSDSGNQGKAKGKVKSCKSYLIRTCDKFKYDVIKEGGAGRHRGYSQ